MPLPRCTPRHATSHDLGGRPPHRVFRQRVRHEATHLDLWASGAPDGGQPPQRARFPAEVPGWLTVEEGFALVHLARGRRVLEVGSYCGRSTACLGQSAIHVHAVDSFEYRGADQPPAPCSSVRERFFLTLRQYALQGKVTLVERRFDETALAELPGEFDFAFIDADHAYESTVRQARLALRLLRPGSPIAFHDYGRFLGVTRAVDECFAGKPRGLKGTLIVIAT